MTYPHIPASFLESLGTNRLTLGSGTFFLLPFENYHGLGFFRLISFQLAMIIIFSKNYNSLKNLNCKKKIAPKIKLKQGSCPQETYIRFDKTMSNTQQV